MSLCPPGRCGCTITSSTLQVNGLAGGVGYNLETYEGVATESPDTRPGPGERFEGMRVWTSDTKRLWVWDNDEGFWRILSEPPQPWVPVLTQGVTLTTTPNSAWFQRTEGTFRAVTRLAITSAGTPGAEFTLTWPVPLAVSTDGGGEFWYFDAGVQLYTGAVAESSTTVTRFHATAGISGFGTSPAVTAANTDVIRVTMTGTYDEATV